MSLCPEVEMLLTYFGRERKSKAVNYIQNYLSENKEGIWRRAWQPTPVLLPGESHRQRSLSCYSL